MNRFKNKVTVLTGLLKGIEAFVPKSLMKKVFITMVVAFATLGSVHAQDSINQDTTALSVVNRFFDRFKSGATPEELASFFDEKAEHFIPGDTRNVPWIGKRIGRKEIAEHFRLLKLHIQPQKLSITDIVTKGNRVVVLGNLESLMKRNESVMKSEFTIDIVVDNGLITRYHLLEDSFEISRAVNAKKTKSKK